MSLKHRVETVLLDTTRDYTGAPIWAVQGESNSLVLDMAVKCKGESVDFSDTLVTVQYRRADGLKDGILVDPADVFGGSVEFLVPDEVFENAGEVAFDVTITDTTNHITLKTPTFKLFVLESI